MAWRLARSLVQLRHEVNEYAPFRSKARDGTIGDAAHASRSSAHNPNNYGVVCALDITHDPEHGMDVHALARRIAKNPHPNLSYIVSDREVCTWASGFKTWRKYGGSNPHTGHAHLRVGRGKDSEPTPPYDDMTPWGVAPEQEEDDMTDQERRWLKEVKLSSVATSFDLKWLRGKANGWAQDELDQVDADRAAALEAKRRELGL